MVSYLNPADLTLAGLFVASFVIGLSGAVMPGPVLAVTITHSARLGLKAGPLTVLGHAMLEAGLVVALAVGLGAWLAMPLVSGLIGLVGGLILVWLGVGMLRSLPGLDLELESGAGDAAGPVRDGFLLSLANPYWSLWWATVGLSLMAMAMDSGLGLWGLAAFYAGHISSDMAWYLLVAFVVAKGRRFLTRRVYQTVVAVCAVSLLGFAVYFGIFAWGRLAGMAMAMSG